jgi:hypothetical protein
MAGRYSTKQSPAKVEESQLQWVGEEWGGEGEGKREEWGVSDGFRRQLDGLQGWLQYPTTGRRAEQINLILNYIYSELRGVQCLTKLLKKYAEPVHSTASTVHCSTVK